MVESLQPYGKSTLVCGIPKPKSSLSSIGDAVGAADWSGMRDISSMIRY